MDIVLHIGAHFTGTHIIERAIDATANAHPDSGVALHDMEGFQVVTHNVMTHPDPDDLKEADTLQQTASWIEGDFALEQTLGAKTLVLSDENLMGRMRDNMRQKALYPDAQLKLEMVKRLLPQPPVRIALGVRDYAGLWTSAYRVMATSRHGPPPMAQVRCGAMENTRGWPDVISAIREVWPDSEIMVWTQDQLTSHASRICAEIAGFVESKIVMLDHTPTDRGPDPELFSMDDLTDLGARYDRDMALIKANAAVRWAVT